MNAWLLNDRETNNAPDEPYCRQVTICIIR